MVLNMKSSAIAVGILAIVVLITMAVLTQFSITLRTSTVEAITAFTLGDENVSTTLSSSYPFPQSLTGCINDTDVANALPPAYYVVEEGGEDGGFVRMIPPSNSTGWNGKTVNCTDLTYLADSQSQGVADTFVTGLTVFATFIGVIVLALIGNIIVGLYKKKY